MSKEFGRKIYRGIPNLVVEHPLSELDGVYIENPLAQSLLRTAPIRRLKGVSQLGFLVNNTENRRRDGFFYTRYEHTLTVTEIGEGILRQNGVNEDTINLAVAASMLHDVATPSFGDATQALDPLELDEEDHWADAINTRITTLLNRYHISKEQIDAIIHNRGILGKVLDIADRTAYVSEDLDQWANGSFRRFESWFWSPDLEALPEEYRMDYFTYTNLIRRMGDIYEDVMIDQDTQDVYFKDVEKLRPFLYYRAALHAGMYMHPLNIGRETMFAEMLRPFYTRDETQAMQDPARLSPSKLRRMTDYELEDHIHEHGSREQWAVYAHLRFFHWVSSFEKFDTLEQASRRADEIARTGARVVGIQEVKGFNPSTDFRVMDKQGRVLPYREADPEGTELIDEEVRKTKGVYVFHTNDEFKWG